MPVRIQAFQFDKRRIQRATGKLVLNNFPQQKRHKTENHV